MRAEFSDEDLMGLVAVGDREAFRDLAERLRPGVKAFLRRLGCGLTETDDVTQETLLRLWVHRGSYASGKPVWPYVLTIAKNTYLSHRARDDGRPRVSDMPAEAAEIDRLLLRYGGRQDGPEAAVIGRYREYRLSQAVARLPDVERLAFVLKHYEGLKYRDIASILDVPEGTVKSRVFRAVRALRQALPDLDPDTAEEGV